MKGHVQAPVLPGCGVHDQGQEFSLFTWALALELFARQAGQPHHVEAGPQISGCRLMLSNLGSQRVLS